jgi:hypothetical protein
MSETTKQFSIAQTPESGKPAITTPTVSGAAEPASQLPPEHVIDKQFEKMFNVFKADENLLRQLTDESLAVRLKAIETLRDGFIRQAMTMAEYRMQQHIEKLRKQAIEPLQTYMSERQAIEFRDEFFKRYPELEPYESIVDDVAAKLQEKGFTAPTRDEVMKRFADDAKVAVQASLRQVAPLPDQGRFHRGIQAPPSAPSARSSAWRQAIKPSGKAFAWGAFIAVASFYSGNRGNQPDFTPLGRMLLAGFFGIIIGLGCAAVTFVIAAFYFAAKGGPQVTRPPR